MVFKSAISPPYLMDKLLSFSALHLSVFPPSSTSRTQYLRQAAELQSRALTQFNTAGPDAKNGDCMAVFIFLSLVGLQSLFDTVSFHHSFSSPIGKLTQYLSLHRSVRTFTHRDWNNFRQTEIKSVINIIEVTDQLARQALLGCGGEDCASLLELLESSKNSLGPESFKSYCDAVRTLRRRPRIYLTLPEGYCTHIIMAWPVLTSAEFVEVLKQRQPEALVVLAYWGCCCITRGIGRCSAMRGGS